MRMCVHYYLHSHSFEPYLEDSFSFNLWKRFGIKNEENKVFRSFVHQIFYKLNAFNLELKFYFSREKSKNDCIIVFLPPIFYCIHKYIHYQTHIKINMIKERKKIKIQLNVIQRLWAAILVNILKLFVAWGFFFIDLY